MSYNHSAENRLESPANYQYAAFGGAAYLGEYQSARQQSLAAIGAQYKAWVGLPASSAVITEMRRLRPAGPLSTISADETLEASSSGQTVETALLLSALLEWVIAGGKSAAGEAWLDRIIQRFEVSKKIYSSYLPGFRKGQGDFAQVDFYLLPALILCLRYLQTANARYLSTLLKVTDLLCSLRGRQLGSGNETALIGLIVSVEMAAVSMLAQERGVQLVS